MGRIALNEFEIATLERGDPESERVAIFIPGRLESKDYEHIVSHTEAYARLGFFAVALDAPGSGESSGDDGDYLMSNTVEAVKGLIRHLGDRPTAVGGHSRGGSVAMVVGLEVPEVSSIVSIMGRPKASIPTDARYESCGFQIEDKEVPGTDTTRRYVLTTEYFEDASQFDLTQRQMGKCRVPKLFIAGSRDVEVDPAVIRELYEQSADPKRYVAIDSGHHYRKQPEMIRHVDGLIEEFVTSPMVSN